MIHPFPCLIIYSSHVQIAAYINTTKTEKQQFSAVTVSLNLDVYIVFLIKKIKIPKIWTCEGFLVFFVKK